MSRHLSPLLALIACLACGSGVPSADTDKGALAGLRSAVMIPGEELGPIRLDEMILSKFVGLYGGGFATLIAGDEMGIELSFRNRQLSFLFQAEGACDARLRSAGRNVGPLLGEKMGGFLDRFPECATTPLQSIAVWAGPSKAETFYNGKVVHAVGLWDSAEAAKRFPGPPDGPARFVAGSRANSDLESHRLQGLWIGYDKPAAPGKGGGTVRYLAIFRAVP